MKNLLALAAAGLFVFAGLGWYLGWYKIQTSKDAEGHQKISIDLDTKKIKEDVSRGKDRVRDYLDDDGNPQTPANPQGGQAIPIPPVNSRPNGSVGGTPTNFPPPGSGTSTLPPPR